MHTGAGLLRADGRRRDQLRPVKITRNFIKHAEGSVLIEMGEQGRKHSREAVNDLSARLNFDSSAFVQLIDVRAKKADRKQLRAAEVVAKYLSAIEKVAAAVDTMQSLPGI